MDAIRKFFKWLGLGKSLWFVILPVLIIILGIIGNNPDMMGNGLYVWGGLTVLWIIGKVLEALWGWFKRDIAPHMGVIIGVTMAVFFLSFITVGYLLATTVPTSESVWSQAKTTMGLDSQTKKPVSPAEMSMQIRRGICLTTTQKKSESCTFPGLDDAVAKLTDLLLHDNIGEFQLQWGAAIRSYTDYKVQRTNEILVVKDETIALIATVNVIVAILGIFLSITLEGFVKTKVTAAFAWVTIIFFINLIFFVPAEAQQTARDLFASGQIVGAVTIFFTLAGVGLTLLGKEIQPNNAVVKWLVKIVFAAGGAIIGIGADTFLQAHIIANAVAKANGSITMNEAVTAYLLGVLAWRGIGSIFGPFILMAQAATVETNP